MSVNTAVFHINGASARSNFTEHGLIGFWGRQYSLADLCLAQHLEDIALFTENHISFNWSVYRIRNNKDRFHGFKISTDGKILIKIQYLKRVVRLKLIISLEVNVEMCT